MSALEPWRPMFDSEVDFDLCYEAAVKCEKGLHRSRFPRPPWEQNESFVHGSQEHLAFVMHLGMVKCWLDATGDEEARHGINTLQDVQATQGMSDCERDAYRLSRRLLLRNDVVEDEHKLHRIKVGLLLASKYRGEFTENMMKGSFRDRRAFWLYLYRMKILYDDGCRDLLRALIRSKPLLRDIMNQYHEGGDDKLISWLGNVTIAAASEKISTFRTLLDIQFQRGKIEGPRSPADFPDKQIDQMRQAIRRDFNGRNENMTSKRILHQTGDVRCIRRGCDRMGSSLCSRCRLVRYCGKDCQRADHKEHKRNFCRCWHCDKLKKKCRCRRK